MNEGGRGEGDEKGEMEGERMRLKINFDSFFAGHGK